MTHFRDLDADQKDAFRELMLRAIDRRIQEEIGYANQALRLLILGNGAGIALLATFMGAVAATGNPIGDLVAPLWKFLLGCVLAALIYWPLMAVASQATVHTINQASEFFLDRLDIEAMQPWGLNRRGRLAVRLLALASLSFLPGPCTNVSKYWMAYSGYGKPRTSPAARDAKVVVIFNPEPVFSYLFKEKGGRSRPRVSIFVDG